MSATRFIGASIDASTLRVDLRTATIWRRNRIPRRTPGLFDLDQSPIGQHVISLTGPLEPEAVATAEAGYATIVAGIGGPRPIGEHSEILRGGNHDSSWAPSATDLQQGSM